MRIEARSSPVGAGDAGGAGGSGGSGGVGRMDI